MLVDIPDVRGIRSLPPKADIKAVPLATKLHFIEVQKSDR
jgi:hypothetical protein